MVKDEDNLYFVMDHVSNGPLISLLDANHKQDNKVPLELTRFYTAWLVLALEKLHNMNIIHRDLKP